MALLKYLRLGPKARTLRALEIIELHGTWLSDWKCLTSSLVKGHFIRKWWDYLLMEEILINSLPLWVFPPPLCFATLHIYVYGNTSKENSFMLTCRKLKQSRLTRPYLGTWKIKTAFSKYKFWNIVSISPCPTTMPVKRVEREVENRKGRRCSP